MLKRVVIFLLKHFLGPFLKWEITDDQLHGHVSLFSGGTLELHNLEVDEQKLNSALTHAYATQSNTSSTSIHISVRTCTIHCVRISVPSPASLYSGSQSILFHVDGVTLIMDVAQAPPPPTPPPPTPPQRQADAQAADSSGGGSGLWQSVSLLMMSGGASMDERMRQSFADASSYHTTEDEDSEDSAAAQLSEGTDAVTDMMNRVMANLRFAIALHISPLSLSLPLTFTCLLNGM